MKTNNFHYKTDGCSQGNHAETVNILIKTMANINPKDNDIYTALTQVVEDGDAKTVHILVEM